MIRLRVLKVDGNSMHPTLASGVFVVVWHWRVLSLRQRLAVGDIVAVNHPKYGQIVKRISQLRYHDSGQIAAMRLCGDNPLASVSEAQMGWVGIHRLIGKIIYVVQAD